MTFSQTLACAPARPDLSAPPMGTLSPPVPRSALVEVLARFRVGRLLTAEPVAEGLLNRGYRVTTEAGDYFLKCYVDTATASRPKILAHHRAMTDLNALGLPVAPPLSCADRGGTVAAPNGRMFALFPWVDGRHRHGTELEPARCDALGTLLGRLHGALDDVCAPLDPPAGYRSADPLDSAELARSRAPRRPSAPPPCSSTTGPPAPSTWSGSAATRRPTGPPAPPPPSTWPPPSTGSGGNG